MPALCAYHFARSSPKFFNGLGQGVRTAQKGWILRGSGTITFDGFGFDIRLWYSSDMSCELRLATEADAEAISKVIIRSLRETNADDYPPDVISRVEQSFKTASLVQMMRARTVFVALIQDEIVGTASLQGNTVKTVFVSPDVQGKGVGKVLMHEVERAASNTGISELTVPSSVTAEKFYRKLGFVAVRDSFHGDERTIIMTKSIGPALNL